MVFPKKLLPLYKNMKAMVRSLDGDTGFFDIVAEVLLGKYISTIFIVLFEMQTAFVQDLNSSCRVYFVR